MLLIHINVDNYKNVYDNTAVSTLGANEQKKNKLVSFGTNFALQSGRAETFQIESWEKLEQVNQNVISKLQQIQTNNKNKLILQEQATKPTYVLCKKNRENQDINALSSQYMAGKQDQNTGMGNIAQEQEMLGNAFGGLLDIYPPKPDSVGKNGYTVSEPLHLQIHQ